MSSSEVSSVPNEADAVESVNEKAADAEAAKDTPAAATAPTEEQPPQPAPPQPEPQPEPQPVEAIALAQPVPEAVEAKDETTAEDKKEVGKPMQVDEVGRSILRSTKCGRRQF
jgi:hypothetical protein